MDEEQKIYAAPQCEVIELELQGMIAASSGAPGWTPPEGLPTTGS